MRARTKRKPKLANNAFRDAIRERFEHATYPTHFSAFYHITPRKIMRWSRDLQHTGRRSAFMALPAAQTWVVDYRSRRIAPAHTNGRFGRRVKKKSSCSPVRRQATAKEA